MFGFIERIISSAGGLNPLACRQALLELARAQGVSPRIAVVLGDDLLPRAAALEPELVDVTSGASLPSPLISLNVYLGAEGIAAALAQGADIVITGRFVELNPGSRKKRYFIGFGAGKAAVGVAGEVRDRNGRLLANFRQRRIAVGGWGGGDSIKKMQSDSRSIGKDLAKFLHAWADGKRLD